MATAMVGFRRPSIRPGGSTWRSRDRLARQFRADDGDKDGEITLEELVERSTALLRRRDADRDGLTAGSGGRRRAPQSGRV